MSTVWLCPVAAHLSLVGVVPQHFCCTTHMPFVWNSPLRPFCLFATILASIIYWIELVFQNSETGSQFKASTKVSCRQSSMRISNAVEKVHQSRLKMAYQLVTNQQLTTSTPYQLGKNLHDYIMITQVVPLRCRISGAKKATEPQKDLVPRWPTPSWRSADA